MYITATVVLDGVPWRIGKRTLQHLWCMEYRGQGNGHYSTSGVWSTVDRETNITAPVVQGVPWIGKRTLQYQWCMEYRASGSVYYSTSDAWITAGKEMYIAALVMEYRGQGNEH